jgi:CheY-like chemotaxis protein
MIKKLLLVEDDPITQMLERIILSNAGFCQETMSLDNGIAAVDWLETYLNQSNQNLNLPELIFLDLNMPMMDGWEFLKLFEEKYAPLFPNTKVIILSSTVNPLDWEKSKEHQVVIGFEKKPLSVETLDNLKQSEVLKQFFVESYK